MIYFVFFLLGMLVLAGIIPIAMAIIKQVKTKQAIMPSTHIKRRVRDLRVGETMSVDTTCIRVDEKRACWIDVDTEPPSGYFCGGRVDVTRTETGYEAKLMTSSAKFKCGHVYSWCEPLEKLEIPERKI